MLDHRRHASIICILLRAKGGCKRGVGDVHALKIARTAELLIQGLAMVADLEAEGRTDRFADEVHHFTVVLVVVVLKLQTLFVVGVNNLFGFLKYYTPFRFFVKSFFRFLLKKQAFLKKQNIPKKKHRAQLCAVLNSARISQALQTLQ